MRLGIWKRLTPGGYDLADAPRGEWVRVRANRACTATAQFIYE